MPSLDTRSAGTPLQEKVHSDLVKLVDSHSPGQSEIKEFNFSTLLDIFRRESREDRIMRECNENPTMCGGRIAPSAETKATVGVPMPVAMISPNISNTNQVLAMCPLCVTSMLAVILGGGASVLLKDRGVRAIAAPTIILGASQALGFFALPVLAYAVLGGCLGYQCIKAVMNVKKPEAGSRGPNTELPPTDCCSS